MSRFYLSIIALGFIGLSEVIGQDDKVDSMITEAVVVGGDTLPLITLDETVISSRRFYKSKRFQRRYGRIKKKVVKVYPYATITKSLLEKYDQELEEIGNKAGRKTYLKNAEDELKAEFEGEITKLTRTEGKILIKLIDRETGKSSYELIKSLRGGFTAFMWQSVAKLFGSDLKQQYDPMGDDQIIEEIVLAIERGEIIPEERKPITEKAKKRLEKKKKKRMVRLNRKLGR